MARLRYLDSVHGDSHALPVVAFPCLASLCFPESSDAAIARIARSLLLLALPSPVGKQLFRAQPACPKSYPSAIDQKDNYNA